MARDRKRRYQSANEMLSALELYLYGHAYGPTAGKLATYLRALFLGGKAYEDDLQSQAETVAARPQEPFSDTR